MVYGLACGIAAVGGITGAHVNAAVTISLAVVGKMSWNEVPSYIAPLAIGFTVFVDIMAGGPVSGATMNPARSAQLGGNFSAAWVYICGPIIGGGLGAFVYKFIGLNKA